MPASARTVALLLVVACAGCARGTAGAGPLVADAYARLGGPGLLERTGGLGFHATGWYDRAAERQGLAMGVDSRGTFEERIVVDPAGRVGYEYRERRYDGTREELREIYPGGDRRLIVILTGGFAVDLRSPEHEAARRKLMRRIPALLLEEVLARPDGLRRLEDGAGDTVRVAARLADGPAIVLHITREDRLLRRVSYPMDYLSFGDTEVSWSYGDYREVGGVGLWPHRYGVSIGGRRATAMEVEQVLAGPQELQPLLTVPGDIEIGEPQVLTAGADASAGARVDTLAPGLFRVANLRGGFHPVFIRMGGGLVAVDAPAGYPLPNELPAGDVAPGPSGDWLTLRYLELMRRAVPELPVTHVVLTHFHNDHGGGVRAFVAEGAKVLASAADTAELRRYVDAPHTRAPDRLQREPRQLRMEAVDGRWVLEAGGRRLEVLEVGPNPHTRGMLVVHLPEEGAMFVSDLLDPTRDPDRYPKADHAPLDLWFGRWLRARGLEPERIYTMHGSGLVTPDHLERLAPADSAPGPSRGSQATAPATG